MIVCGMEMKASEVHLVLLTGTKESYEYLNVRPRKIVLGDDRNTADVCAFRDTLYAFLCENNVEVVSIKQRSPRGPYAGGSISFKLEGIAQLYDGCVVQLVSSQTIAASLRRYNPTYPKNITNYQVAAFETAFSALQ